MKIPVAAWITATVVVGMAVSAAASWFVFFFGARTLGRRGTNTAAVLGVVLLAWLAAALLLGLHGFFEPSRRARFPSIALGFAPILVAIAAYAAVKPLREAVKAARPHWIIGVQLYRVLGFVFLVGDILIGLTAPLVALLVWKKHRWAKGLALAWNVAGIYDLVQAVALGFLTAPSRYPLLALNAPNFAIGAFPLVVVPTFAVPLSILLHFVSLRRTVHP